MMDLYDYKVRSRIAMPPVPLVTIYCEGPTDAALYEDLGGAAIGRLIRFVGPPTSVTGEGGAIWAYNQMRTSREHHPDGGWLQDGLNKAYCLVDGEERLRAGSLYCYDTESEQLVHTRAIGPDLARTGQAIEFLDRDGMLFLNCHEKENIYFLHGGVWEEMKRGWTKPRNMFDRLIGHSDHWRILYRAAAFSMISSISKRYRANSEELKPILGKLRSRNGDTDHVVGNALKELKKILPFHIYRFEADIVLSDLEDIDENVDADFYERRDMFRFCDGGALLGLCSGSSPARMVQRARTTMMDGRVRAIFQSNLIEALFGEGRPNADGTETNFGGLNLHLTTFR